MSWEQQNKKIGALHRENLKKAEAEGRAPVKSKPSGSTNPFPLVTHIDGKPIKSANSMGLRKETEAGSHEGRLGQMNTGRSEKEVYSHVRQPHSQREPNVFDLVTHIDDKPIK